jgi:hypothetical protein
MQHGHFSAEAAGKAAQAEELRVRFEALSAQKAGLVQQLKQVHRTLHSAKEPVSSFPPNQMQSTAEQARQVE